jgi:glycogen operon protein
VSHGDELGRTQRGNNNAYCQDGDLSWVDWEGADHEMLAFARAALALRRENAVFRRRRFFEGAAPGPGLPHDVAWLRPDGAPMQEADWHDPARHALALAIPAEAADAADERGRPQDAVSVLLLLNGGPRTHAFTLAPAAGPTRWRELFNTACAEAGRSFAAGERLPVAGHALVVLAAEDPG